MTRSTKSIHKKSRHRKVLKQAKGFYGRSKSCFKIAKKALDHKLRNKFISRKQKKRNFRSKFIKVINSYCLLMKTKYSEFIKMLNKSKYKEIVDRKSIAILIQQDGERFKHIFNSIMH